MKVTYIGGMSRSGTTLLQRMLGELPDVVAIGESCNIWKQGIVANELCGCGEPFNACQFWREVGDLAFGGWAKVDVERVVALRTSIDRTKSLPRLAKRVRSGSPGAEISEYGRLYERLYYAVGEVSGADTVVDASKQATLAYSLRACKYFDLRVVHLIRDSRGVAYSWTKTTQRPGARDQATKFMPTVSPVRTAAQWGIRNLAFDVLGWLDTPLLRLRYEQLIHEPRRTLQEIAQFSGLTLGEDAYSFVTDGHVSLPPRHAITGNPMRVLRGNIRLQVDEAWRSSLPPRDKLAVSTLTGPQLKKYGYRF